MSDRTIKCADCKQEFLFTEKEQEFYTSKGFTDPKRCRPCREARKDPSKTGASYGNNGGVQGNRPVFTGICDTCGAEARVPFDPHGRPIQCSPCYKGSSR